MCRQLEISRAAYYKWLHREIPYEELENIRLAELIKEYDERFCHILGYRRMTSWINHFNHTSYSKNRVHRIMKKLGIHSVIRKKKKKYIYAKPDETAENILQRDFYATVPNQKWATDVTEFKVPGEKKKLYLSAIIDLYDRYPVAYVVSARNDNRLIFKTFDKAIAANPDAKPIFHSDRGFQYTSKTFKKKLENQEMEQSMSRVGHCIDNGPIEGFWGIIKSEMYQMYEIIDEVSLRYAIKDYLRFYSEHGAVGVAACARCIACRHAAQAGRSLGWIGGEELLGAGIELVECQKACGVPSVRGDGLVGKMFAQLGKDHAGLHAQVEHARIVATKAQVGACAREVHNVSAGGHGATGKTGAAALHGDGRAGGIQFA